MSPPYSNGREVIKKGEFRGNSRFYNFPASVKSNKYKLTNTWTINLLARKQKCGAKFIAHLSGVNLVGQIYTPIILGGGSFLLSLSLSLSA